MNKIALKIKENKARFIYTVFYLALFIGSVISAIYNRKSVTAKNLSLMLALIFASLSIYSLIKLFKEKNKETFKENLKKFWSSIFETLQKIFSPLYQYLVRFISKFMPDYGDRIRIRGQDKRSFIFDIQEKQKKPHRLKNTQKWSEQDNNIKRVRFIYTEYMIKKIKSGYFIKSNLTPREISDIISIDDDKALFDIYQLVRYDNNAYISNETLKALMIYTKKAKISQLDSDPEE